MLLRFENKALGDTCERVARDPMRKLDSEDRLAGALRQCEKHDVLPIYICMGTAATIFALTKNADDARKIIEEKCKISGRYQDIIIDLFGKFADGDSLLAILQSVARIKRNVRGKIV